MSQKMYAPVPLNDERRDSFEDFTSRPCRSTTRKWTSLKILRQILCTLAGVLIFVFGTLVSAYLFQQNWPTSCAGQGIESHLPVEHRIISRIPPEREEAIWDNLRLEDPGFVWIDNPSKYGLPLGVPHGPKGLRKLYGLSWTHQLHCLMMIRDEYHSLQSRANPGRRAEADPGPSLHHIEHCFDYLRQNIECVSDMTIEWADQDPEKDPQINGYGVSHVCRKKESVMEYMAARVPPAAKDLIATGAHSGHYHER
ncbi:hypothetical protein B0O99DRAFT_621293 [Bisporella sp. PMI_857]|nr:hypothetical protein B0O99DRAFT_621293 [Bisporella sp. PMI_857]